MHLHYQILYGKVWSNSSIFQAFCFIQQTAKYALILPCFPQAQDNIIRKNFYII